jgi:hypothetical protein
MRPFNRRNPAPVISGSVLNDERGFWSVVVPQATTNLILNPSFENAISGWSVSVGSATVDQATDGAFGISSLRIVWGGFGSIEGAKTAVLPNTTYTFSCYMKVSGMSVANSPNWGIRFLTSGSVLISSVLGDLIDVAQIGWKRRTVTFTTPATAAYVDFTIGYAASGATAWMDAFQLEKLGYMTTYCDGDQPGCYWTGGRHISQSSRLASEPTGGRVWNFKDFGFAIMATIAAGAPALTTVDSPYVFGGGFYQLSTPNIRQFTISGTFEGRTLVELKRAKQELLNAIKPYRAGGSDPVRLVYQPYRCNNALSDAIVVDCVYTGGLEGVEDNESQARAAITFRTYLPAVMGQRASGSSVQLNMQTDFDFGFTMAGMASQDRITGAWSLTNFSYGANPPYKAFPDGRGNIFTVSSSANYLIRYINGTTDTMGTTVVPALNYDILDSIIDGNNNVYVVGGFSNIGGASNVGRIAKWDGTTWSALSTNAISSGIANAISAGPDGKIYVGGSFTNANNGALSTPQSLAVWDGTSWATPAVGPYSITSGTVTALLVTRDNVLWWAQDIGSNQIRVCAMPQSGFVPVPFGYNEVIVTKSVGAAKVTSLVEGLDGKVYIGGDFDNFQTPVRPGNGLMVWSGSGTPTPLPGLTASLNVKRLIMDKKGLLHIQAAVGSAAGLYLSNGGNSYLTWNGTSFNRIGALLRGVIFVTDLTRGFVGSDNNPVSQITTVVNGGGTKTYPTLVVKGGQNSILVLLKNYTTGKEVQFNIGFVNPTETLTVTFRPDFTAKLSGGADVSGYVLGGSDTDFYLAPGPNRIEVFVQANAALPSYAYLQWTDAFDSIDGVIR